MEDGFMADINIKIDTKEHLSVVGLNGAGKTTFIKLLCRLYDVTEGEILIDGRNIKDYSEEIATEIDKEVRSIVTECLRRAVDILTSHRDKLDAVADYLIRNEKMSGEEFKKTMSRTALDF